MKSKKDPTFWQALDTVWKTKKTDTKKYNLIRAMMKFKIGITEQTAEQNKRKEKIIFDWYSDQENGATLT